MRRRGWVAVVLVLLLALGGGAAWAAWGRDDTYGHRLAAYGKKGEANRFVNLDRGQAQLALGSPDGRRLVVQWRDPDGHGWTAPETVWKDAANVAVESTVRYGGGTVAIVETYTADVHDDSDLHDRSVGLVCRDLRCTARRVPGSQPRVTPDGRSAYFGQDEKGAYLWTGGIVERAAWSGRPGINYVGISPSEPVLAPDGSLRIVVSRPSLGSCTFALLVGKPSTASLHQVAHSTQPLRGRSRSDCRSYLDTFSADWVSTHPDDHRAPDFWFVRRGTTWTTTRTDPSHLALVDRVRNACCGTAVAGFAHWNDVAYSSPDAHRLQVQTHLLGDEVWSSPVDPVAAGVVPLHLGRRARGRPDGVRRVAGLPLGPGRQRLPWRRLRPRRHLRPPRLDGPVHHRRTR